VQKTALIEVTPTTAVVGISSPAIAFKITGGTIRPKRGRMLAIPATATAYAKGSPKAGRWAEGELFMVKPAGKPPFLATQNGDDIEAQYWLVPSVTQAPDPNALPSEQALEQALREETIDYLTRLTQEIA